MRAPRPFRPFFIALQFLTCLPVRLDPAPQPREVGRSALYYPAVGLLLGLALAGIAALLDPLPQLVRAALVLAIWVALTGALHLDGLADSADAWLGGLGDRERTLAIMKDAHCGTAAVVALVVLLLFKFAVLASLESTSRALVIAPLLARSLVPLLLATAPYVRPGGLGAELAASLPRGAAIAVLGLVAAGVALYARSEGAAALAVVLAIFFFLRALMLKRIGGTTGDTAGALVEIAEAGALAAFLPW